MAKKYGETMLDTRRHIRKLTNHAYIISLRFVFTTFTLSFLIAFLVAFIPTYNMNHEANIALFILLFAAGLWITEAIPAFAVSLLVIALEILLLGFENFNFASGSKAWEYYLSPWSSPLIFLFLAGFIMAAAASKTKLDVWLAKKVLFFVGNKPHNILTGIIVITFALSMFVSNTATAVMMMTIVLPLLDKIKQDNPFGTAILLAVVIGSNLGGMATIIGTPPNAIAVGALGANAPSFVEWIILALPPAMIVVFILRWLVLKKYPSTETNIDLQMIKEVEHFDDSTIKFTKKPTIPSWKKQVTIGIFIVTVILWLTSPLHHILTTVVSLIPIIGFTLFGIIDADDITKIRWDVIILIVGGLSLGLGVSKTGLDLYIATLIPTDGMSALWIMLIFSYIVVVISNFMSNTAATNIMLPIVIAVAATISQSATSMVAIAVALSASYAMCLPVSTPPNAIVYSSQKVKSKDFLLLGITAAILGPLVSVGWLYLIH